MASILSTTSTFIQPLVLTVTLVYLYGAIGRWKQRELTRNIILGGLFGLGVVMSMSMPITLADGLIFDMRNLLVGIAAALLGPVAAVITVFVGVVTRVLIGGQGAVLGVLGILVSAAMGVIWRNWVARGNRPSHASFVLLGAMISMHISLGVLLPDPVRSIFFTQIVPLVLVANLLGAWVFGGLMTRERDLRFELLNLRTAADTDPLTNLLNRRSLIEIVERTGDDTKRKNGRVMFYFDVDRFKSINDVYGHLAGDKILQCLSERIKSCLRPGDVFARLGGDEFVVMLPDVTRQTAHAVAERCREVVFAHPFKVEDREIAVTISLGATYSDSNVSFDALLSAADEALYEAKADGRNSVALDQTFEASEPAPLTAA